MKITETHTIKVYRNDVERDDPYDVFVAEYTGSYSAVKTSANTISDYERSHMTSRGRVVIQRRQLKDEPYRPQKDDLIKIWDARHGEYVGSFLVNIVIPQRRSIGFVLGEVDNEYGD